MKHGRKKRMARRGVLAALACCLLAGLSGCALVQGLDKERVLDGYNAALQTAGIVQLTGDGALLGTRTFGADGYVGAYAAEYQAFSGTEYLFGNTGIARETGMDVTVDCTFEVTDGSAQLVLLNGAEPPVVLFEGAGAHTETLTIEPGGSYLCVVGDGLTGSVALTVSDAE